VTRIPLALDRRQRSSRPHQPISANPRSRKLGEAIVAIDNFEARLAQLTFDNTPRNVMFFDLLFTRFVEKAIDHALTHDEQPAGFQTAHHALEDFAIRDHFVIRIADQHGIERAGRKLRVRQFTQNDVDVRDGVLLSTVTQLVE
jgi:hypothetical protein